jgi:hypothetical protein
MPPQLKGIKNTLISLLKSFIRSKPPSCNIKNITILPQLIKAALFIVLKEL